MFKVVKRKAFRIKHTFKCVPKHLRIEFLKSKLLAGGQEEFGRMVQMRKAFNQTKHSVFPLNYPVYCYCCDKPATHRHHVVPLSRGGRNKVNNIVPLCFDCHSSLHPHLK